MKSFFSSFLASLLAIFVAAGLMVLILVGIIAGIAAGEETDKLTEKSVLELDLAKVITERQAENGSPFSGGEAGVGLDRLREVLDNAATDTNIEGILLHAPAIMARPSTALDVRQAIVDFREKSGKWVIAYCEEYTQGGYYISSAADKVYLYPTGMVDFRGTFAEVMFFKNMLTNLGIDVQVIRGKNNKFKSAVEPFMLDKMSDANREQMTLLMQGIWEVMVNDVSASRNIPVEKLNQMADSLYFRTPQRALEGGLVDGLKYEDEVEQMIKDRLALDNEDEINYLSLNTYYGLAEEEEEDSKGRKDRIAVVYAIGDIISGEGDDETIGSERIAKALRDARLDEKTKAIVLRVNSPGGSALASDVIWRETMLIKQDSIPLIVSMGDYAASGGYYISCAADKIFANPNTLTGSIGVFGLLPNMQKFWNEKIGITFDGVKTNAHADLMNLNKPLDTTEYTAIQDMVEGIYTDFITIVAQGRGLEVAYVDSIGQGRVWTGKEAQKLGLVDEIGNLPAAIKAAAEMAGLENYKIRNYPDMIDPFEQMLKELKSAETAAILSQLSPDNAQLMHAIKQAKQITSSKGIQARMPFWVEFK